MKEKTARRLMAFLAAVCMFGTMPETALISRAEEGAAVSSETGNTDTGGQEEKKADSGADGQTDTQTPDGEKTGEGTEETEKAEDAEGPKDTVKPGDSAEPGDGEDIEDTEDTKEPGGEGTKDPEEKAPDSGDKEKEETAEPSPEGSTEETEGEITETVSENTVETEPEESEEVGVMLLSAQAEETAAAQDADSTYTDENGVIYHYYGYEDGTAEIYELEDCKESTWDYKALNIPSQIGDYTVTSLTFSLPSETPTFPSVTIPETITYMKDSLFKRMKISELYYNAEEAETGAGGDSTGVFCQAYIWGLHIGGNVKVIPDYCFASSYMTVDELTIDVERIGEKAFDDNKTITTLTIGENVKEIGRYAFNSNDIDNINYNAVNAVSESYGGTVSGVFGYQTVSNIMIGDGVTAIPEHLFCSIDYTADTLIFPDSLTTIGEMAFYGSNISIGELTIGENITSIGKNAFARGQIGTLHYNAVDARISGATESDRSDNCFELSEIGKLHIGERVKSLPDTLFCNVTLTQDTLKLPDSVTYIGAYVLSYSGGRTKIGTLEIGENVTHIGRAAFGVNTYDKVIVRAVEADTPPSSDMDIELPLCSSVEIHGKSPYYKYFTRRTDKDQITLLCEDFETTRGEEYYDAQKKSFVTPITDTCTVCGYEETSEEYSEAHTVIFTDYDGRELSRQHLHKGEDATAPEEPERTGYRFTGWDRSFTNVTSDLTVTAEYEIRKFSVVFKDGARIINEQEVAYGGDATAPGAPTRPEEEWGRWKFTGWSGSYTDVTGDRVITAQFEKVLNQYEVVFYDAEGNVLSRQTIVHGEDAEEPDAPEKEPTAQYSYVFTGWSAATEGITGNTVFYPVYDAKTRSYTVKFMDGSIVLDEQTVEYGGDATMPKTPTRPEEVWGRWRFTRWSGSYTNVTGDRVVTAQFEKVLNQYEVLFCDAEGNVLSRQMVEYGGDATAPKTPTRPEEEWGRWKFTGWSGSYTDVTGDRVITAQFEKVLNQYEVVFYDAEGNVLSRQTIVHGEDAEEPDAPEKEPTAQYSYVFTGWSAATEGITGNTVFYPVYDAKTRSYTVKFMDGSTVLDTQTVEYGSDATAPGVPTRPEEDWGHWRFTGWRGSYTKITKDEVIRAEFEQVFHVYEVIFYDADNNILSRQTVRHGMGAEAPKAPVMEPTEKEYYVFVGWDGDISHITGKSHFHPVYETKPRTYTVTFMNGDISCDVQKVAYGLAAIAPADPVKEEDETYTYRFIGWDKDYSYITGDLTVHAVFERVVKPKDDPDKDKPDEGGQDKDKDKDKDKPKDDDSDGEKPGDGDGDGGQQPGGETGTEGGQPEGDPAGNAGEKNGDPAPETIAEKTILRREALPEMAEGKEPVFPIPEIPDLSAQPEEKGVQVEKTEEQEMVQTAESKETEGTHRQIHGWLWLLLLLGAGTGAWGIWLWLAGTDDKTICGTVMDEDGNAMSGVNVTLTGEEGKPVETQTDEDGQYLFENLKKDSYRLCFHYIDATGLLLLDIHMERRDRKKVFSVLKSVVNAVETKRSGGRYQIDVTV